MACPAVPSYRVRYSSHPPSRTKSSNRVPPWSLTPDTFDHQVYRHYNNAFLSSRSMELPRMQRSRFRQVSENRAYSSVRIPSRHDFLFSPPTGVFKPSISNSPSRLRSAADNFATAFTSRTPISLRVTLFFICDSLRLGLPLILAASL